MARIVAISSYVAHGHVGLSAMVPALHALGHEVIGIPSVVLSNHYGHPDCAGSAVEPDVMAGMLEALQSNGWLEDVDALISGYLANSEQVELVAKAIDGLANNGVDFLYACDPVLGDDPGGLYIKEETANALRDELVTLADVVTPNRFELAWLAQEPVKDAASADAAAEVLDVDVVLATSIPAHGDLATLLSSPEQVVQTTTPHYQGVPHGVGDLFAALFIGHALNGCDDADALGRTAAAVELIAETSRGADELKLVAFLSRLATVESMAVADLGLA
ncbi:MAG: pyridoxal kinase [Pseudomonadota bacterium]